MLELDSVCHFAREKLGARRGVRTSHGESSDLHAGLEPIKAFCSDLDSAVEVDQLNSPGIENRGIPHAIGLQFVGCYSTKYLESLQDTHNTRCNLIR